MNIIIYKSKSFKSTSWSGGSTTELFIYPPEADFQKRDFEFRLSTATVEVEESIFTPLKYVDRTLMVLDGQMTLTHKNQHTKTLDKFEIDEFDGGWHTQSNGSCVDFNLMTRGDTKGRLSHVSIEANQSCEYSIDMNSNWIFIYSYLGEVNLTLDQKQILLKENSLVALNEFDQYSIHMEAQRMADLVVIQVSNIPL